MLRNKEEFFPCWDGCLKYKTIIVTSSSVINSSPPLSLFSFNTGIKASSTVDCEVARHLHSSSTAPGKYYIYFQCKDVVFFNTTHTIKSTDYQSNVYCTTPAPPPPNQCYSTTCGISPLQPPATTTITVTAH